MKNLFLLFFLVCSIKFYSQQKENEKIVSDIFFNKYKKQKRNATILSVTGGVLLFTGFIISKQESEAANLVFSKNEVTGYSIASLGIISIIGSIPLYISAEKNYKKSVSISPSVQTYHFYNTKNTSLGLNITYSF